MMALAFLSFDLPTVSIQDSVQKSLKIMHSNNMNVISVLDKKQWIGNITEEMLMKAAHPDGKIDQFQYELNQVKIETEEDILASLPFFEESGFWIIPVVDEQMKYQGYLPWQSVAKTLFYTGFNVQNGGIIRIVFHTQRDSMSVIAKIIEENKGLITRSYLTKSTKEDHIWPELILQIQTDQFSTIVKSLERHEIHIEKAFMFGNQEEVDQSRFDLLLKYLNP
jgi:acetoin utilization protein AcuB